LFIRAKGILNQRNLMLINTDDMAGVEVVRTRKSKTHRGGTGGESKTIDPWQAG
jgi:hypothetical protein